MAPLISQLVRHAIVHGLGDGSSGWSVWRGELKQFTVDALLLLLVMWNTHTQGNASPRTFHSIKTANIHKSSDPHQPPNAIITYTLSHKTDKSK